MLSRGSSIVPESVIVFYPNLCSYHARKYAFSTGESVLDTFNRRRFLKGTAGVAASLAAVPALSGVAAAHFPVGLDVDIQPGNEDNFIDLDEHDYVSVTVHSSEFLNSDGGRETFDPTERDVRYRFGSQSALDDGAGARPVDDVRSRQRLQSTVTNSRRLSPYIDLPGRRDGTQQRG